MYAILCGEFYLTRSTGSYHGSQQYAIRYATRDEAERAAANLRRYDLLHPIPGRPYPLSEQAQVVEVS